MKLLLQRNPSAGNSTIGALWVDGVFECHTLEDALRTEKIHGRTAIPAGVYTIKLTQSPRFKRILPLLLNVPNFEGVRIHPGNTHADTEGCILPGKWTGGETITESRKAFDALYNKLQQAEDITIDIRNSP